MKIQLPITLLFSPKDHAWHHVEHPSFHKFADQIRNHPSNYAGYHLAIINTKPGEPDVLVCYTIKNHATTAPARTTTNALRTQPNPRAPLIRQSRRPHPANSPPQPLTHITGCGRRDSQHLHPLRSSLQKRTSYKTLFVS